MSDVVRPLRWRFWFGGPWMSTSLVTAAKPAVRVTARVRDRAGEPRDVPRRPTRVAKRDVVDVSAPRA